MQSVVLYWLNALFAVLNLLIFIFTLRGFNLGIGLFNVLACILYIHGGFLDDSKTPEE